MMAGACRSRFGFKKVKIHVKTRLSVRGTSIIFVGKNRRNSVEYYCISDPSRLSPPDSPNKLERDFGDQCPILNMGEQQVYQ